MTSPKVLPNNSELVLKSQSYVTALHTLLAGTKARNARKPRGSIQRFALHLNCHTSFIAQVLGERANLSVDQGILACELFGLNPKAQEHFLDLLLMERSGVPAAKSFFLKRIEKRRREIENLSKRWDVEQELSENDNWLFFSSWLNQIVYSAIHIPRYQDKDKLRAALNLSPRQIAEVLKALEHLKLLEIRQGKIIPKKNWLHLSKESPVIRSHHQTWRMRAIEEFSRPGDLEGFHYSGAVTLSKQEASDLREDLLELMDKVRQRVASSASESSLALSIDFFPLA